MQRFSIDKRNEDEFLKCDFSTILKSITSKKDHFMFANGIKIQDLQLVYPKSKQNFKSITMVGSPSPVVIG